MLTTRKIRIISNNILKSLNPKNPNSDNEYLIYRQQSLEFLQPAKRYWRGLWRLFRTTNLSLVSENGK